MTSDELHELAPAILANLDATQAIRCAEVLARLTTAEAYVLQQAISTLREQRGEVVIGYKIGCTSRAIQEQLGIRQPIFGRLFDSGELPSSARLSWSRYSNLAVEGELALRLAEDVPGPPSSDEECHAVVESVFPVIELHHYRLQCDPRCAAELIVRNGMHAGFVAAEPRLGRSDETQPIAHLSVALDNTVVGSTAKLWAMGSPWSAIRWLAGMLGEAGLSLRRGQVILTGSVLPLFEVGPGSDITIEAPPYGTCVATVGT